MPSPLQDILSRFPAIFAPSEGNEDKRWDLLRAAGIPENAIPRLMATMAYARNESKAPPGWKPTQFQTPQDEQAFQNWVKSGNIAFDVNDPFPGYDMRAWWQAMVSGNPSATYKLDPRLRPFFPNTFNTPYSLDFDRSSQYWNLDYWGKPKR